MLRGYFKFSYIKQSLNIQWN